MSIKANELRLGNWIYNNNNEYQVTPYVIEELWASVRGWVQPISLTDKWLIKFGFEKYDTNKYSINHFYIRKVGDEFETQIGECLYKTIDYVHQLQNIYFALTNEELEIKR